jgi:hypothetical protein
MRPAPTLDPWHEDNTDGPETPDENPDDDECIPHKGVLQMKSPELYSVNPGAFPLDGDEKLDCTKGWRINECLAIH